MTQIQKTPKIHASFGTWDSDQLVHHFGTDTVIILDRKDSQIFFKGKQVYYGVKLYEEEILVKRHLEMVKSESSYYSERTDKSVGIGYETIEGLVMTYHAICDIDKVVERVIEYLRDFKDIIIEDIKVVIFETFEEVRVSRKILMGIHKDRELAERPL